MRPRARDGRWATRFGSWVASVTVAGIARELSKDAALAVGPKTVHSWLSGRTSPRSQRAWALVEMSGGALTLDDVYRHREVLRTRENRRSDEAA